MVSNEGTFKYSTFTIQIFSIFLFLCLILAIRYFKIKNANLLFIFFSFVLNVILKLSIIFGSIKISLENARENFHYDEFF